jgi:hypothetical protein
MTEEILLMYLQDMHDSLSRPLYNPLESGFRHTPLKDHEKLERYADTCACTADIVLHLIKELQSDQDLK